MSTFTSGPWRLKWEAPHPDYEYPYMRLTAGDGIGDANSNGGFELSGIVSEADARLIAAAPVLYALLDAFINNRPGAGGKEWLEAAQAAIADLKRANDAPSDLAKGEEGL